MIPGVRSAIPGGVRGDHAVAADVADGGAAGSAMESWTHLLHCRSLHLQSYSSHCWECSRTSRGRPALETRPATSHLNSVVHSDSSGHCCNSGGSGSVLRTLPLLLRVSLLLLLHFLFRSAVPSCPN